MAQATVITSIQSMPPSTRDIQPATSAHSIPPKRAPRVQPERPAPAIRPVYARRIPVGSKVDRIG